MNSQPKISVIVPVYKTEGLLDRCVESIVGQTYKNLEIILVDDGSPDNCPAMCDEWAEKDSRIRVIHKENGGVSSARNAALDIATGDYIGFVDSDDWIEPEMYASLIRKISESGKNIALCSYYAVEISRERNECRCVADKEVLDRDDYFVLLCSVGTADISGTDFTTPISSKKSDSTRIFGIPRICCSISRRRRSPTARQFWTVPNTIISRSESKSRLGL